MLLVLISFIAFIALFVLGLRWGVVIIGKVLGRVVYDRHRNAEYIINTGQVPEQWIGPYFKKMDEARTKDGVDETEREAASPRWIARRNAIRSSGSTTCCATFRAPRYSPTTTRAAC